MHPKGTWKAHEIDTWNAHEKHMKCTGSAHECTWNAQKKAHEMHTKDTWNAPKRHMKAHEIDTWNAHGMHPKRTWKAHEIGTWIFLKIFFQCKSAAGPPCQCRNFSAHLCIIYNHIYVHIYNTPDFSLRTPSEYTFRINIKPPRVDFYQLRYKYIQINSSNTSKTKLRSFHTAFLLERVVDCTPVAQLICTVYSESRTGVPGVRVRVNSSVRRAGRDRVRVSNQDVVETGYAPSS